MDFLNQAKNALGGDHQNQQQNVQNPQQQQGGSSGEQKHGGGGIGGFLSGLGNKANEAAGGGRASEKNEDYLDKGIDYVQEKFMGQGPQDNESAIEQAKDEQISDMIRGQYKSATGKEFFVKDKPTALDKNAD